MDSSCRWGFIRTTGADGKCGSEMKCHTEHNVPNPIFDAGFHDIEKEYATLLPAEVKTLLNDCQGQFIQVGDGQHYRVLSRDEILDSERHLGLNCVTMGAVPLIECKDNNFLVYNAGKNAFEMINIVDGMAFSSYPTLLAFWKSVRLSPG
jgi:hypothetical protein